MNFKLQRKYISKEGHHEFSILSAVIFIKIKKKSGKEKFYHNFKQRIRSIKNKGF